MTGSLPLAVALRPVYDGAMRARSPHVRHRSVRIVAGSLGAIGAVGGVLVGAPRPALAVPGPDSVAVLANAGVPESLALAQRYAAARSVPPGQVCAVSVPDQDAITLGEFRTMVLTPLEACLTRGGAIDRIEAVVLVRGIPLRVMVPDGATMRSASLAATLSAWRSRSTTTMMPLIGQPPGMTANCSGTPCYAARWRNPFRAGTFDAGWTASLQGIEWQPLLVTMLNARSYDDAARLVTSAVTAEQMGGAHGRFVFMNGADAARGVLDAEYDGVIASLQSAGITDVARVPFDTNTSGLRLAGFFTGTASLGTTIESNTFLPGALVDNLTSFGADPVNFHATGESQVSIARFIAAGASGAHGTVDEPLNNVFPSRTLIVDYVHGFTLAEAYARNLPFAYWRNLVLGDPMLAPYATRPVVTIEGVSEGATHAGAVSLIAWAREPGGRAIASITLYIDGLAVAHADGDRVETCYVAASTGAHAVLAVAQLADDGTGEGPRSKGWRALSFASTSGPTACGTVVDAGVGEDGSARADTGLDGGTGSTPGGCGCRAPGGGRENSGGALLAAIAMVCAVKRRSATRVETSTSGSGSGSGAGSGSG